MIRPHICIRPNLHCNNINCILSLNEAILCFRNAYIFVFFLLPRRQSGPLKSFSAPIIAPACTGRGRGLHSVAAGRIHADVNLFTVTLTTLSNHLVWKLSPFVSTLNFLTQEQKLKLHEMWWGGEEQIPADKARPVVLWPCWPDIICLYLPPCHSPSVMKREPLHCSKVETGSLIRHPPVLQIFSLFTLVFSTWKLLLLSRVCWTGGGWGRAVELESRTFVIWAQLCFLPWMEWQLVMAGAP